MPDSPPWSGRLYRVACAAMFTFGIVLALPGTVVGLGDAVTQLGLTLTDRGTLISALFVGLLLGSAASATVVDALGERASVAGSAALVALCLPLLAFADGLATASASIGAVGFASAGMNTAANALSSNLFPHERGRRMNGLALMAGLGGLALPALAAVTAGVVSWRGIVLAAAAVSALVAVAAVVIHVPPRPGRGPAGAPFVTVLRQPGFGWFILLLLLGPATEASMAGWTSTYLGTMGFSESAATWALSSHWLGLVAGRVIFSQYVDRGKAAAIARAALAGAVLIGVFAAAPWSWLLATAPFAIGLAIAVVVPTSLALAGERYPTHPGTLFGVLLTFAQAGAMIMPAAIGVVAGRHGLRAGLLLLIAGGAATAVVTRHARGARPGTT